MKILVAGGCGYVGSMLVPALADRGYVVEVVDLKWFGNQLPDGIPVSEIDCFELGIGDFEGYDQVIFIAGLSNDPMAESDPAANYRYNAALPAYMAYAAKQAGVKRFIYASSASIYGFMPGGLSCEGDVPHCKFPYGLSKYLGERGCDQLCGDDFSVIALRKGTIGGHSPRMRFDLIVNTMARSALTYGFITVDNPSLWRPILDIRSAVAAYVRAVEAAPGVSGAFNIADGNYTVGGVADEVAQAIGGVEIRIGSDPRKHGGTLAALRNYAINCTSATVHLGWHPKYSIADTVQSIVHNLNGYGDLYGKQYSNISVWDEIRCAARTASHPS